MSFTKRLKRLEAIAGSNDAIAVLIFRWSGEGEHCRVRYGDLVIERKPGEDEEEFFDRAERQAREQAPQIAPVITLFAERRE